MKYPKGYEDFPDRYWKDYDDANEDKKDEMLNEFMTTLSKKERYENLTNLRKKGLGKIIRGYFEDYANYLQRKGKA